MGSHIESLNSSTQRAWSEKPRCWEENKQFSVWLARLHFSFIMMMKLLYTVVYTLLWILLGLRHVLGQLRQILCAESLALLGRSPTASEVAETCKGLKHWTHLGCVLDHTHFGRNGMLSGAAIAQLVSLVVAADSSHTSVFLPRRM